MNEPSKPVDPWTWTPPAQALLGRVVLVVGAGGGLGSAVARACARHGATAVLLGRDTHALEKLYDVIETEGGPQPAIFPLNLETAGAQDFANLCEAMRRELSRLDGIVHAAGTLGQLCPFEHADVEMWNRTMMVNLQGPVLLTRACLGLLRETAPGSVVFTLDDKRRAYWGGYGVSKAALAAFARILAHEAEPAPGEPARLRVNAIDPGPLRTALRLAAYPAEDLDALALPDDCTAPFLYLLSSASQPLNGYLLRREDRSSAPL